MVELERSGTAEQKEQVAGALRNLADLDGSTKLPPIMGEQLREAASTYKEHTGRGCDAFHPRWFAWLSDELLAAFALFLMSLEQLGVWPSQISAILIALVPQE